MTIRGLLTALCVPPLSLMFVALAGLLFGRRRWWLGRVLLWTGLPGLLVLAMPVVGGSLLHALERDLPRLPPAGDPPQAIVILSGDRTNVADGPPDVVVGPLTLTRERTGAALARRTGLPVLVSGGVLYRGEPPLAVMMADSLRDDFQVPVRWTEPRSIDTWENARFSAEILRAAGIHSIYLVTHGWHMRRALAAFAPTGLTVTAAPSEPGRLPLYRPEEFVPSVAGWQLSYFALHEWIGLVFYALR